MNVKLCDLGTATAYRSLMMCGVGTVEYAAPEVYSGKKYDEKCDVYSFAMSMWALLAGRYATLVRRIEEGIIITSGRYVLDIHSRRTTGVQLGFCISWPTKKPDRAG